MLQQEIQSHTQQELQQQADKLEQQNELIKSDNDYELEYNEMDVEVEENYQQTDVVSKQVVFELMEKFIFLESEKCSISPDNVIELLKHYKWNLNKLEEEYFQNPNLILLELQKNGDYNNHDSVLYPQDNGKPEPCQNCKYESPLIQLGCKHKICQNCLYQLINQKIYNGEKKIPCLIEICVYKLPTSMISTLIPKKNVEDLLVQEFVSSSDEFIICKNEQCQKILKRPNNLFLIVNCECGQSFCFRCKLENHAPVSCQMANDWLLQVKNLQILNASVHEQIYIYEFQTFSDYQQKQEQIQNSYKSFKNHEITQIKDKKQILESEIETLQNAFKEIESILLFQKWITCLEYNYKQMNQMEHNPHQMLNAIQKEYSVKIQEKLENLLLDVLKIEIQCYLQGDSFNALKCYISQLEELREKSENLRKPF